MGLNSEFKGLKTQSVPRSKHFTSVIKTNHVMLYREIIAVLFLDPRKTPTYTVWEASRIFNVKPGGTYSNHWALKG